MLWEERIHAIHRSTQQLWMMMLGDGRVPALPVLRSPRSPAHRRSSARRGSCRWSIDAGAWNAHLINRHASGSAAADGDAHGQLDEHIQSLCTGNMWILPIRAGLKRGQSTSGSSRQQQVAAAEAASQQEARRQGGRGAGAGTVPGRKALV